MAIKLSGYLRDNPAGTAVPSKTVSLLDVNTDLAPVTNTHTNLSSTTDVTDSAGFWEFTMDLMTGPLYVSADLGGGNVRVRRNTELFVYESWPINNLPAALRAFGEGVIDTRTPATGGVTGQAGFEVTPTATRILTIAAGNALIRGYVLGWDSGTKTLTGTANGASGTTRHDFVVLRQWYAGTSKGKQDIVLVAGTASTDPVATTTETDLTQFIRGANIWDLPIARGKLAFGSTLYTVEDLRGVDPYPFAGKYLTGSSGVVTGEDIASNDQITSVGNVSFKGTDLVVDANGVSANQNLRVAKHIIGITSSPSVSPNAVNTTGAGVGATASIGGSDMSGEVTVNIAGTPGVGQMALITMDNAMNNSNFDIHLTPIELDTITNQGKFRAMPVSTTTWKLEALATPDTGQHVWRYFITGRPA